MIDIVDSNYQVYIHRRKDTRQIFYIGKGRPRRATETRARNDYRHRIVKKYGYIVRSETGYDWSGIKDVDLDESAISEIEESMRRYMKGK